MNKLSLLAVALLASAAVPAMAATNPVTTSFNVTLTVQKACTVTTPSALAFGTHDYTESTNIDNTTNISVKCTKNTSYNVGIDAGGGGGTVSTRTMKGTGANTDTVAYALYRDSARTQNWGVTTGAGGDTYVGTGNNNAQTIPVYGRVLPASLNVTPDNYSDTVNVTVTY
ncbi:MAG: spore coat protein U domain-containing protein [Proteobacteria bacterium]|nr:spore coat protein U domain-containing protein [Pseudomonadota bacterium]